MSLSTDRRASFQWRLVLAAALSLLAFAVGSQAAQANEWSIETAGGVKTLSEVGSSEAITLGMPEGKSANLTWTISGTAVSTNCSSMTVVNGELTVGGTGLGKLQLSNCSVASPVGCTLPPFYKLTTNQLQFTQVEAGGKTYLVFKPVSGTTIGTITYTGTCAIAGTPFKITGSLAAEMPAPTTLLAAHDLAFVVGGPSAVSVAGLPGVFRAPITIKLAGANAGRNWGVS